MKHSQNIQSANLNKYSMFINGSSHNPVSGLWFDSKNPYTGNAWAKIPDGNSDDVDTAVIAAHNAFLDGPWSRLTATDRGCLLYKLGNLVARDAIRLAKIEVQDNGKLLAEMQGQVEYIPQWFYYYGGLADKIQGNTLPLDKKGYFAFTRHEPIGVVAAITPWNSPLFLLAWKIAPALAAGCTVVVKPSEYTSASTLEFAKLFEEAGFPKGVFNVVTGYGETVGKALVEHPLVSKVCFTGSDTTGRVINQLAAKNFTRTTMELGGKSPNIVFEDANLDEAVFGAISGIFAATGQTCIAGSRLLVQKSIYDKFVEKLLEVASSAKIGNPMDESTQVGPVTTQAQLDKVRKYIEIGKNEGARVILGGGDENLPIDCKGGWFVQPTIFSEVNNNMRIAQEEIFGPVLSIIKFDSEEEAIKIANKTRFGLASAIWTTDIQRALRLSEKLQTGMVWINTYRVVSFMAPFGGCKDSGFGRENGKDAIYDFLQTKTVWINAGVNTGNPFIIR